MEDIGQVLSASAERLFSDTFDDEALAAAQTGAWDADRWRLVEDAGLPLALIAEEHGGMGIELRDAVRLIRIGGYYGVTIPLLETMLANRLLAVAGFTPPDGPVTVASDPSLECEPAENGWRLVGSAPRVPWGRYCSVATIISKGGDTLLGLVPAGVASVGNGQNVAREPRDRLDFDLDIQRDAVRPLPATLDASAIRAFGATLRAAAIAGALERTLELSVNYSTERRQFGKTIGSFQMIQGMLASAAGQVVAAGAAVDLAMEAFDRPDFAISAAIAKGRTSEAAGKVAAIAHQVHGAIGMTREYRLNYFTTRLWAWREEYGNETEWYESIGRHVSKADSLWPMVVAQ